ncbi:MAG: RNA polymerase sigma factor [Acutalibacteraceae bacterium]
MKTQYEFQRKFNDLWNEYHEFIENFCTYRLQSMPDIIEDCIQDVFLDLYKALEKGEEIKYPKAWLTVVANNKIKDLYTRRAKETENTVSLNMLLEKNTLNEELYSVDIGISDEEILRQKENILNTLTEDELYILNLRITEEKSFTEIAEILNISEGNARIRFFRIKKNVIDYINKNI